MGQKYITLKTTLCSTLRFNRCDETPGRVHISGKLPIKNVCVHNGNVAEHVGFMVTRSEVRILPKSDITSNLKIGWCIEIYRKIQHLNPIFYHKNQNKCSLALFATF